MHLYHYYDSKIGPFVNLSDISITEAIAVLDTIKETKPNVQSATRSSAAYMERRHVIEEMLRTKFTEKGGIIRRKAPHYMVVEHSPWLTTWFENAAYVKIPIEAFDLKTVSFTYGDAFPVFSDNQHQMDDREFRRQLYTYDEIVEIIAKYGLPQDWNSDGAHGPSRYVEAHVWCDNVIDKYRFRESE